jgi:hypothetical protein
MSITLDDATDHLNLDDDSADLYELSLYVDAANEWIATRVTDMSPAPVTLAALFLVGHWWESQRGTTNTPLSDEDTVIAGIGYAIPNRVLELIDPWRTRSAPRGSFPDAVSYPDPVEC